MASLGLAVLRLVLPLAVRQPVTMSLSAQQLAAEPSLVAGLSLEDEDLSDCLPPASLTNFGMCVEDDGFAVVYCVLLLIEAGGY